MWDCTLILDIDDGYSAVIFELSQVAVAVSLKRSYALYEIISWCIKGYS